MDNGILALPTSLSLFTNKSSVIPTNLSYSSMWSSLDFPSYVGFILRSLPTRYWVATCSVLTGGGESDVNCFSFCEISNPLPSAFWSEFQFRLFGMNIGISNYLLKYCYKIRLLCWCCWITSKLVAFVNKGRQSGSPPFKRQEV